MKKYHGTMIVKIHNIDQSQPMIFDGVDNTYTKAGFFCIVRRDKNEVRYVVFARMPSTFKTINTDRIATNRFRLQCVANRGALMDNLDAG